ncbi:MAG TPA: metalloregulator ArsR/SmtB family transcription factor [Gemmatimonadales bacterium]|jgi:ArsR family transcriptional regulator|nr:metalloregulator ArsR/SmtB family transcription factor [Gemmatimonadales bacterium]
MTAPAVFGRLSALADPIRGRLLLALERQELSVREIQAALRLPQSTVSRHLKVLADLGLVVTRSEGTSNWYRMPARDLPPSARRLWLAVRDEVGGSPEARRDGERLQRVLAERHAASQRFFATAAGRWDRLRSELFGERAALVGLLGLLDEHWTVGDLGCGTGQLAATLAPFVRRVVGVDESAAMLRNARQRARELANLELRIGALEALPVRTHELDAALLVLVLHHAGEPARVLAEAHRVLKRGGRLLVVDMLPHEHAEYREQMGHQWLGFAEPELRGRLTEAHFEAIRFIALPADPAAKGPPLFAMTARAGSSR